jgi:hypothetical protein
LRRDARTRDCVERRVAQGKTRREAIRCLKRYAAREIMTMCDPFQVNDRYVARGSVLGDVGQAGHVTGQQLLSDRAVQNLDDLVRLHGSVPPSQRSCSASPTMMPSGPRM